MRTAVLRSLREETREVDFVCSTDSVDSYGEIVRQNWDLKRFSTNPVALFAHNSGALPIGHWKNVRVEAGELTGTLKVGTLASNPVAENVFQCLREGSLRAVSVGFWPHKISVEEIDGHERVILDDNELCEISVVPVPANADAIGKQKQKAIEEYRAKKSGAEGHLDRACPEAVDKGAVPYAPTTPDDASKWDHGNALKAVRKWASSDGSGDVDHIDWSKYKQAFAWYDASRSHEVGGYKLPHHTIRDGKLVVVRGGVIAAGNALQGSRGGVKIPDGDVGAVRSHLAKHYRQFDLTPPWEEDKNTSAPVGASKGKPIMATKDSDGDDDEKGMVECPKCGEMFKPKSADKDKKHIAALTERAATADLRASTEESSRKTAEAERDLKVKLANEERDAVKAELVTAKAALAAEGLKVLALQVESDLSPLVGVKLMPAERDGHIEIGKHFLGQGEAGAAKWKAHLEGIKSRSDMSQRIGGSVLPTETEEARAARSAAGANDDGGDAVAVLNEMARKGA